VFRKDIAEDIYFPKDPELAEGFKRYMANKTKDLQNGQRKNILLYVGMNAYFVEADGYLTGNITKVMPVLGNERPLPMLKEEFESVTEGRIDGSRENVDEMAGDLGVRVRRSGVRVHGAGDGSGEGGLDVLYGRSPGVDQVGRDWGDYTDEAGGGQDLEIIDDYIQLPDGTITNAPMVEEQLYSQQNDDEDSSSQPAAEPGFCDAQKCGGGSCLDAWQHLR